jgi:hypothetical protein
MALHCSIAAANRMATAVPLTAVLRELAGPQGAAFNPRRGSRYRRILRSRIPAEFQGIRWGTGFGMTKVSAAYGPPQARRSR